MAGQRTEFPLVDTDAGLAEVVAHLADAPVLAIDTEFVRERTYFAELCVVQVATPNLAAAVDCLAPIGIGDFVGRLLDASGWLLHSARQDLEVLYYRAGRLPGRLIDTQIAAGLVGLPAQVGLKDLLEQTVGVSLDKQHTRANWARRPLTPALQEYALEDVRYLEAALETLLDRLESLGRTAWFDEDCARQLAQPIEPDTGFLVDRTKGAGRLTGARRAAVFALVDWRERRARELDRPRRWVLGDEPLVELASAMPATQTELETIDGLPKRFASRSGEHVLETLANAPAVPEAPEPARPDKAVVRSLQDEIRGLADGLGIQPELIATRRDIVLTAAGIPPEILLTGWRSEVLGETVRKFSRDPAC